MESPIQPHEAKTIYIQFSDTGRHIRKWSLKPFEGGSRYVAQPVVSDVMAIAHPRNDGKRVDIKAVYRDAMKKYPRTMAYLAK